MGGNEAKAPPTLEIDQSNIGGKWGDGKGKRAVIARSEATKQSEYI
jgi:hypothetical protein